MLQSIRQISPVARAILVIGVVAALVTSITFAALQSQATLTNNTITSATAELLVDSDGDASFDDTDAGFAFTGLVPGGAAQPTPAFTFALKNNGGVSGADLTVAASIAALPVWSDTVNNSLVDVKIDCTGGIVASTTTSLQSLFVTGVNLGTLANDSGSEIANCTAQVQMQAGAFTGSSVNTTTGFDLVFTGTGV